MAKTHEIIVYAHKISLGPRIAKSLPRSLIIQLFMSSTKTNAPTKSFVAEFHQDVQ